MSIIGRLKAGYRAMVATTPGELEKIILGGGTHTNSGAIVTPDRAMRNAAVFTCVRVLAESVAQLPLGIYEPLDEGGSKKLTSHPLYSLLHNQPNSWQTSFEFRELMMACLGLRGDSVSYKVHTGVGRRRKIKELIPFHPDTVSIRQLKNWELEYNVNGTIYDPSDILHVKGLSLNGYSGVSPIQYQRESIGLAIAAESHGAKLFKNGALPGGILKHPKHLSEEGAKRLKASWDESYGGGNTGKTAILEDNMTFEKMTMTNEDAQYLETRKFQRSEIAGIYRIPAHMINDLEKATFSNIEHQALSFVVYTLTPWLTRIEQALWRDLLTQQEKDDGLFFRFNVDGLLRGDSKSRAIALQIQRLNGIINANEWRALENMNPIEGGDTYLTPLNMRQDGKEVEDESAEGSVKKIDE